MKHYDRESSIFLLHLITILFMFFYYTFTARS